MKRDKVEQSILDKAKDEWIRWHQQIQFADYFYWKSYFNRPNNLTGILAYIAPKTA